MTDPSQTARLQHARDEQGFTLAEMLAALAILLFGVTALLGALATSINQRRSAEAMLEFSTLCDLAVQKVQQQAVRSTTGSSLPFDLEFVPLVDQPAPGFPGMTWSAKAIVDDDRPDLWLVQITAKWLDEGEESTAEFFRVLPRQLPLRDRVLSFREGSDPAKR
ncbi:MAG: type II secretion system protein [Planctomycetota bacterium]|nr:type II secretion system protein [Planctomycetota bacterium]